MQCLVWRKGQLFQLFSVICTDYLQIRYLLLDCNEHLCVVLHMYLGTFLLFPLHHFVLCYFYG